MALNIEPQAFQKWLFYLCNTVREIVQKSKITNNLNKKRYEYLYPQHPLPRRQVQ